MREQPAPRARSSCPPRSANSPATAPPATTRGSGGHGSHRTCPCIDSHLSKLRAITLGSYRGLCQRDHPRSYPSPAPRTRRGHARGHPGLNYGALPVKEGTVLEPLLCGRPQAHVFYTGDSRHYMSSPAPPLPGLAFPLPWASRTERQAHHTAEPTSRLLGEPRVSEPPPLSLSSLGQERAALLETGFLRTQQMPGSGSLGHRHSSETRGRCTARRV